MNGIECLESTRRRPAQRLVSKRDPKVFLSARPSQTRVQSVSAEAERAHVSGILVAILVKRDEIPQALYNAHDWNRQSFVVVV